MLDVRPRTRSSDERDSLQYKLPDTVNRNENKIGNCSNIFTFLKLLTLQISCKKYHFLQHAKASSNNSVPEKFTFSNIHPAKMTKELALDMFPRL